eukprot:jgi/Orpsp1_1/1190814/evm.model.d7180000081369.1
MITGLIKPTNGKIFYDGIEFNENELFIRENMGICYQENILFNSLTVEENLKIFMGLKNVKDNIEEILKKVDLSSKMKCKVNDLSGGQKRKLCIGISILGNPKYLFLDEPTSSLDPVSRRRIWQLLSSIKKNRIIFMTTHYMDEADIVSDRKLILSNGIIRCLGTSIFLKNHFNMMYNINVQTNYPQKVDQILRNISPTVIYTNNNNDDDDDDDDIKIKNNMDNNLKLNFNDPNLVKSGDNNSFTWKLPISSSNKLQYIFEELNKNKKTNIINNYSLKSPSLEDLFMKLLEEEEEEEEEEELIYANKDESNEKSKLASDINNKENEILIVKDFLELPNPAASEELTSLKKLLILIKLRYKIYSRNLLFIFNIVFIPTIISFGIFVALKLIGIDNTTKFEKKEISPSSLYTKDLWNIDMIHSNLDKNFFNSSYYDINIEYNNDIRNFNKDENKNLIDKNFISFISGKLLENNNFEFDIYYNETKLHSNPLIVNYI